MSGASPGPGTLPRGHQAAEGENFDLAVVGGGIYGAFLLYEAASRGLRAVLVERSDFGAGTSGNSLRILHGGLRYLQRLDLARFRESVRARAWFFRNVGDLVAPLACLMPLWGKGLRRPAVFRVALGLNDLLSLDRNRGVPEALRLGRGAVLSAEACRRMASRIPAGRLRGGAVWYDGWMRSSERVLMEILRAAAAAGGVAVAGSEAVALERHRGRVAGLELQDVETGAGWSLKAERVLLAAGPWTDAVLRRWGVTAPPTFHPSLAFNALLDAPPPSENSAVAVEPEVPGGRTYFLLPWRGRTLAGTFHAPWAEPSPPPEVPQRWLRSFREHLDAAVPGAGYKEARLLKVFHGLLPVRRPGSVDLTDRPLWLDASKHGGPEGLTAVVGIKYTTARDVARRTLRRLYGGGSRESAPFLPADGYEQRCRRLADAADLAADPEALRRWCRVLWNEEAPRHLDDLLLRRMGGLWEPGLVERVAREAGRALGLSGNVLEVEMARLRSGQAFQRPFQS